MLNLKILLYYIKGYVRVEVEGFFIERLINLCMKKSILLWNSKRKKATILYSNVGIKDYKEIVKIAKETKCRIKIKDKKGLPFIFYKYKKRKIFFVLLSVIITLIIALSNFIWNIEIVGNEKISDEELIELLENEGLKIGILKGNVDKKDIINNIRLKRNDIAWMGIEFKGTNAIVNVAEATQKPDIVDENDFCNIVAIKPGKIVKVNAINGVPLVKEGDVVRENTPLIGGWIEGKYTGRRYVHANGVVEAKVWYSYKEKIELNQVISRQTGECENKYSVNINNFKINLYKTLSKFQKYDTIEKKEKIKLFRDFYLPIEITKITHYELIDEDIKYSVEDAKNKAVENAKNKLDIQVKNKEKIVNTYVNYNETDSYIEAEVTYEVLEEIGKKEKIEF